MPLQSSQHGPFSGGVNSSTGAFVNPKGTVPRASNLLGIQRGALATCDGSAMVAWHSGAIQLADSRFMAIAAFEPTGIPPYFLALKQTPYSIGVPYNMTIAAAAAGVGVPMPGLDTTHSYVYAITALDGVGGESLPVFTNSGNGVTGSGGYTITWTGIPNAFAYNIYREDLTLGTGFQLLASPAGSPPCGGLLPVPTLSQQIPSKACGGNDPGGTQYSFTDTGYLLAVDNSGNPIAAPTTDTNQQTALLRIFGPNSTQPQSYDNSNIVALFPPPIQKLGVPSIIGNQQIPAGQQAAGNAPVQILNFPGGLTPITASIAQIRPGSGGTTTAFLQSAIPTGLRVNDPVAVSATLSPYDTTYTVLSFGQSTGGSFGASYLVLSGQPSTAVVVGGLVQFDLVTVTTITVYTAAQNSMQPIAGVTDNPKYNGTWQVRVGGTGTSFVVAIPGAQSLLDSGGGSFGSISTPSSGTRAAAASPLAVSGIKAPIQAAPAGLNQYQVGMYQIGTATLGGAAIAQANFPASSITGFPAGLQQGDVGVVTNTAHFNGKYTVGKFGATPSGAITMVLSPMAGTNLPGQGVIENTGTLSFNVFGALLVFPPSINIPSNLGYINISGAGGSSGNCSFYNGNWVLRQGGNNRAIFTIPLSSLPPSGLLPQCGNGFLATLPQGPPVTGGGIAPPINIAEYATINGGIVGLLSPVPQMLQFTNRMIMALGNGYAPQYYADSTGTPVNQAISFSPASFPIVTDTTGNGGIFVHVNMPAPSPGPPPLASSYIILQPGSSFILTGASPASANGLGQIIAVTPPITDSSGNAYTPSFTAYLFPPASAGAVGSQTITGGSITITAAPLNNNFTTHFPTWQTGIAVNVGDIYVPAHQPASPCAGGNGAAGTGGVYIRCTQAGITATEPTWPDPCFTQPTPGLFPIKNITETGKGTGVTGAATATSGTPIWEEVGWLNQLNPPPPGAAHAAIYSYCLFLWNTYPFQTGSASTGWGIDGPTSLRQSDVDNPFSWNPANQAYVDKDDGTEGMGVATWTIAAVGITPIGSLFLFKNYSAYQVTGLFGAGIDIARIRTERGCTAPRTARFIPGLGVGRLTHLGVSVTDGVNDQLISDAVRPYLFVTNDRVVADITPIDPNWLPFSYADLTANPPMYCMLVPVGISGSSNGALTRALAWDIGQTAWYPIDFPFNLSVISQQQFVPAASVTYLGGWNDGLIQRWQYDDELWLVPGGTNSAGVFVPPSQVQWSYRTPVTVSQNPDQRVYFHEISLKGLNSHQLGPIFAAPNVDGVYYPPSNAALMQFRGTGNDFLAVASIAITGQRCFVDISGSGGVELDSDNVHIVAKPLVGRLVIA